MFAIYNNYVIYIYNFYMLCNYSHNKGRRGNSPTDVTIVNTKYILL